MHFAVTQNVSGSFGCLPQKSINPFKSLQGKGEEIPWGLADSFELPSSIANVMLFPISVVFWLFLLLSPVSQLLTAINEYSI